MIEDLKTKVVAGWVIVGILGGMAIALDVYSAIAWSGAPTKAYVRHTAAKEVRDAVGGQNVVLVCERSISAAVQGVGEVVTGYKNPTVKVNRDGSVHVTVNLEGDANISGPGHCDLTKGIYQVVAIGPGR